MSLPFGFICLLFGCLGLLILFWVGVACLVCFACLMGVGCVLWVFNWCFGLGTVVLLWVIVIVLFIYFIFIFGSFAIVLYLLNAIVVSIYDLLLFFTIWFVWMIFVCWLFGLFCLVLCGWLLVRLLIRLFAFGWWFGILG